MRTGNQLNHHFICPTIQRYAHLHRYSFRRAGQQGPTRTLTVALKRSIKQLLGTYSITQVKHHKRENYRNQFFSTLFLKTFKNAKFTVDGSAYVVVVKE